MSRIKPHHRIRIGRNVALTGGTVYCATRSIAYMPGIAGGALTEPVALISMNGHLLWAWAGAWMLAAVLCVVDMIQGHTRRGLHLTVGLAVSWGLGYALSWAVYGFVFDRWTDWWVTSINYFTIPAIVWGLLVKVQALHTIIHPAGEVDPREGG